MCKRRALTVTLGVVFLFSIAAVSVNADAVHEKQFIGKLNGAEHRNLELPDVSRAEEHRYLFDELSNNGKHLGFGVASFRHSPRIGLVGHQPNLTAVTQNPEPATIMLLGTGLAALGALARRKAYRSK